MDVAELKAGYTAFQDNEVRDAMYKTAIFLVKTFWGKPAEMSDGLGVLLLTWNNAFYRYGPFDFSALEKCIAQNQALLDKYRDRNILDYSPVDDGDIEDLYRQFMEALQIAKGKMIGRQSPVAAVKALHLLAPAFFPLWDDRIARQYDCRYEYITFMQKMQELARSLAPQVDVGATGKTLLKLLDEYNYAKFTKGWV